MKIIKRKKEAVSENAETDAEIRLPAQVLRDDRRGMVNVVKSWITERDVNRRAEKIAAARSIFAWKTAAGDWR